MVNRKLVRPNLAQLKERMSNQSAPPSPAHDHSPREGGSNPGPRRRPAPQDATAAEAFYYLKQMNQKTPMVVVLDDGEQLRGHIEWYDKSCVKVHREGSPNLLVFKHCIRYMFKQEDELEQPAAE